MTVVDGSSSSLAPVAAAALGGAVAVTMLVKRRKKSAVAPEPPQKLQVYGFLPLGPDPDSSPFCIKLLTWLKMARIDFDYVPFPSHGMKGSSKGKMPYVYGGPVFADAPVGDSSLIIDALVQSDPKKYDLDAHLSKEERAIGTAFKVMIEESCYWSLIHVRWNGPEFERYTSPFYFGSVPSFLRGMISRKVQGKIRRDLRGQGTGLLDESEILAKWKKEVGALADFLGDTEYLLGSRTSSFDATVYAFLAAVVQGEWRHEICDVVRGYPNLMDYIARMRKEFWPELQEKEGE
ncbi:hypothetical protein ACHAXT_009536 [Thalassiosira profunda]